MYEDNKSINCFKALAACWPRAIKWLLAHISNEVKKESHPESNPSWLPSHLKRVTRVTSILLRSIIHKWGKLKTYQHVHSATAKPTQAMLREAKNTPEEAKHPWGTGQTPWPQWDYILIFMTVELQKTWTSVTPFGRAAVWKSTDICKLSSEQTTRPWPWT